MSVLIGFALGVITTLIAATVGDMVSEEVRSRLDRLPHAIVRLAIRRLPLTLREEQAEEWAAELHYLLQGAETRPITRLARGVAYALGLLKSSRAIGIELSRTSDGRTEREELQPAAPPEPTSAGFDLSLLSGRERTVLAFEAKQFETAGTKEQAIHDTFNMSATRYFQILNVLIDDPAAEQEMPQVVKRLRQIRDARIAARRPSRDNGATPDA